MVVKIRIFEYSQIIIKFEDSKKINDTTPTLYSNSLNKRG